MKYAKFASYYKRQATEPVQRKVTNRFDPSASSHQSSHDVKSGSANRFYLMTRSMA